MANHVIIDHLQLITIFVQVVQPYAGPNIENPAVKYCGEILPIMTTIVMNFTSSTPILERVCRCWRYMIISYRTSMIPLLPALAESIANGFQVSREGCFLWATDAVVREFSDGAELVDQATSSAVFQFYEQQAVTFLRILNDLPPENLPDGKSKSTFSFQKRERKKGTPIYLYALYAIDFFLINWL